jgi:hypothetical protein
LEKKKSGKINGKETRRGRLGEVEVVGGLELDWRLV